MSFQDKVFKNRAAQLLIITTTIPMPVKSDLSGLFTRLFTVLVCSIDYYIISHTIFYWLNFVII